MNTSPRRFGLAAAAFGLAALGLAAGCGQFPRNRKGPASILSTGSDRASARLNAAQTSDVQVAMGRSMEAQGESVGAIAAYEAAIKQDPKRVDAIARLAVLRDRRGEFSASAPLYDRALKAAPDDPEILADRGYSLYLQGRYPEAESSLRRSIARKADLPRAHNNLGLVLARTGRGDSALGEFAQGGCTESDARLNLAFALTLDHHWDLARSQYALALAADPASTRARSGLHELDRIAAREGRSKSTRDADVLTAGAVSLPPPPR